MLEARNLSKSYGDVTALSQLNVSVEPGELYVLLGANGAGKSTTMKLFLGFSEPTEGTALVNGLDVAEHPYETKDYLAYIPDLVMLYPELTGRENLQYFSKLGGHTYSDAELSEILLSADLQPDAVDRKISMYSKGMRQKIAIAIAIAKQAKAVLLDEPFSGLDPKASNEFANILKKMKSTGVAIIMATHDMFRAKELATRIGIMRDGRMVEELDPTNVSLSDIEEIYVRHMS